MVGRGARSFCLKIGGGVKKEMVPLMCHRAVLRKWLRWSIEFLGGKERRVEAGCSMVV